MSKGEHPLRHRTHQTCLKSLIVNESLLTHDLVTHRGVRVIDRHLTDKWNLIIAIDLRHVIYEQFK